MELPGPLVSSAWLSEHLGTRGLVVADVRWAPGGSGRDAYAAGHLPGAVFLDADDDLSAIGAGAGRHPLPSPEAFAATMAAAGIGDETAVIAYDDTGGSYASRLWWMLDAIGRSVAILDGALTGWGGAIETGPPPIAARARCTPQPWSRERLADAGAVTRALGEDGVVLDARAAARFRGDVEPFDPVAGHIPGARSAPWEDNLDPATGRLRSPEDLRARYEALGVRRGDDAIAYCGSGITAALDLLALRVAGFPRDGRLYGGSWSGWIEDPSRPVATGD